MAFARWGFHTPTQLVFGEGVRLQLCDTLRRLGVEMLARESMGEASNCKSNPVPLTIEDATEILRRAIRGD